MSIPFTQYFRPSGRPRPQSIDRPAGIERMAETVLQAGSRFEAEVLPNGLVHLDVCKDDEQLTNELVPNGPEVLDAVDRLVQSAYAKVCAKTTGDAV